MALIKCPECGREVSDKAAACPHCGCPASEFFPFPVEAVSEELSTNIDAPTQANITPPEPIKQVASPEVEHESDPVRYIECPNCGAHVPEAAKYCPVCFTEVKETGPSAVRPKKGKGSKVYIWTFAAVSVFIAFIVWCGVNSQPPEMTETSPTVFTAPSPTPPRPTPVPTPKPTPTATTGEKNALKKANSYLSVMAFSYTGLIEQLEYEGFSHSEAVYGADNCGANWKEQAVKKAKSYLNVMAFSKSGLIEQLEYEGFTHSQALYGAEQNGY